MITEDDILKVLSRYDDTDETGKTYVPTYKWDDVADEILKLVNKNESISNVSESSLEDKLYNKCLEGMPDITKEEFEDALNTWLHQYTKSKQIENFNPHSR